MYRNDAAHFKPRHHFDDIEFLRVFYHDLLNYIKTFKIIQLFQLRLSPSKAEKSNTSAKSLLGVTIKNRQTEQNLVSRVRVRRRDLYS